MEYRKLGKTNLNISKISFGTIPILNGPFEIMTDYYNLSQKDCDSLINHAYEQGINFFDTATNNEYSDAESKLGTAITDIRDDIFISSKSRSYDSKSIIKSIENSLKTLNIDHLDFFFVHQVKPNHLSQISDKKNGAITGLIEAKNRGLINHIGIATHHVSVVKEIQSKFNCIDVYQLPINIIEYGIFYNLKDELKDTGVLGMKIFSGGTLSKMFSPNILINVPLSMGIHSALIGFGKKSHIDDAINALEFSKERKMNINEIREIVLSQIGENICNRCQKCICDKGIEIDKILRYRTLYLLGKTGWSQRQYNRQNIIKDCDSCNKCLKYCEMNILIPNLIREANELLKEHGGMV